jgi:hypothetical protein
MPSNWKAYILNENERPVSTTVRQHLKKWNPQLPGSHRPRNFRPMIVLGGLNCYKKIMMFQQINIDAMFKKYVYTNCILAESFKKWLDMPLSYFQCDKLFIFFLEIMEIVL